MRTLYPLKGFQAFDAIFRHGERFAYRGVTAFILFENRCTPDFVGQTPALGHITKVWEKDGNALIVGVSAKRRTRPAAMRNRVKRLLRAAAHLVIEREGQSSHGIVAMVLVCNIIPAKPSLLRLDEVLPLVRRIIQNADKYYSVRHPLSSNSTSHKDRSAPRETTA